MIFGDEELLLEDAEKIRSFSELDELVVTSARISAGKSRRVRSFVVVQWEGETGARSQRSTKVPEWTRKGLERAQNSWSRRDKKRITFVSNFFSFSSRSVKCRSNSSIF